MAFRHLKRVISTIISNRHTSWLYLAMFEALLKYCSLTSFEQFRKGLQCTSSVLIVYNRVKGWTSGGASGVE